MIEVRNVTRAYGKRGNVSQALRGISFQIPTGATAAIIGKSGSGKSTLMHLMGGLDTPTSGEILIDGKTLTGLRRRALDKFRARDLGFVFQSFFVEANQTCYQNVALPLEINNVPRRSRRQLAEKALEQVELFDKSGAKASTLSGGQKQRLAIARAVVHRPRIILADEPTGNLDSATGDKVIKLLFDLNRRLQCTLVIVTHDPELAARCQYQIAIKDGQLEALRRSPSVKPPVPTLTKSTAAKPTMSLAPSDKAVGGQASRPSLTPKPVKAATPATAKPAKPSLKSRVIQ